MDAVSLGFAVFTTFKELYLLSKFICRTLASVRHSDQEKAEIDEDFRTEVLYLRSVGILLFKQLKINEDKNFDKEYLILILNVFDRLRILCGDYAKIATVEDKEYQAYSPYLNPTAARSKLIEFSLELDDPPSRGSQIFTMNIQGKPVIKWIASKLGHVESWKWALYEKRKLGQLLRHFQRHIGKLKDLVPLVLALSMNFNNPTILRELETNDDAVHLGLTSHVKVRQHLGGLKPDSKNLLLLDTIVESSLEADSLIPLQVAQISSRERGKTKQLALLEYKTYQGMDDTNSPDEETASRVKQLADLLSCSEDSELHILHLEGYVLEKEDNRYAFLFNFPKGVEQQKPLSLYEVINSSSTASRLTLNDRFKVAQGVAKALGALHADGWVHKSFRSHSIVFFSDSVEEGKPSYHKPFLVGFQFSRPESAETQYTFGDFIEHNVYRHPDRQGIPTVRFSKIHDIYALGVVLLEIGISQTAISLHREASLKVRHGVQISPRGIQNVFIEVAKRRVAHYMGQSYLEAVDACLSGTLRESLSSNQFPVVFQKEVIEKINFNGF